MHANPEVDKQKREEAINAGGGRGKPRYGACLKGKHREKRHEKGQAVIKNCSTDWPGDLGEKRAVVDGPAWTCRKPQVNKTKGLELKRSEKNGRRRTAEGGPKEGLEVVNRGYTYQNERSRSSLLTAEGSVGEIKPEKLHTVYKSPQ